MRFDMQAKEVIAGGHTLSLTKVNIPSVSTWHRMPGRCLLKNNYTKQVFGFDAEGDSSAIAQRHQEYSCQAEIRGGKFSDRNGLGWAINGEKTTL